MEELELNLLPDEEDYSREELDLFEEMETYEEPESASTRKWSRRVADLGEKWVMDSPENAAAFAAQTTEVFVLIYERLNTVYRRYDEDLRSHAAIHLWADIKRYDPSQSSLEKFLSAKIKLRLRGLLKREYQKKATEARYMQSSGIHDTISVDSGGDNDNRETEEILTLGTTTEAQFLAEEDYRQALAAMVLNFRGLMEGWTGDDLEMLHYRMFYTEQITAQVQTRIPARQYHTDIFRAMYNPYLCYFAEDVPQPLTMPALHRLMLKREGQVIPGKPMDVPLDWDDAGFLPAKVQCCYLQDCGRVLDADDYAHKVHNLRTKYKRKIYKQITI